MEDYYRNFFMFQLTHALNNPSYVKFRGILKIPDMTDTIKIYKLEFSQQYIFFMIMVYLSTELAVHGALRR